MIDTSDSIQEAVEQLVTALSVLPEQERIDALNRVRMALHDVSPLRDQPIDCVMWVPFNQLRANDYNPNRVAPPEMDLLRLSIAADGYTQPIVAWDVGDNGCSEFEVIDGFHRNRVGREYAEVRDRICGRLPISVIRQNRVDRGDRISATIRHNRARGKHRIDAMSDIVVELKRRNWTDAKIAKNLGMEADEVLRLKQITGLAELFAGQEFSQSWEVGESADMGE